MKTGRKRILIRQFLIAFLFFIFGNQLLSQECMNNKIEEKAIDYFCNNIELIIPGLDKSIIRFSGKTKGTPSSVFNIADCIGEINLLKDSIPNKCSLDSLYNALSAYNYAKIETGRYCFKSTGRIFDLFDKSIYVLNLFNQVEYKGDTYVELYLINDMLQAYIIVLRFHVHSNNEISHFVKSRIY